MKVLAPTAILGYGFPVESFQRGMAKKPDFIGIDAGSTDPGPYYLGSGELLVGAANIERDLGIILPAAIAGGAPVVIGSAGGAGTAEHVRRLVGIITAIAAHKDLHFRLGIIHADVAPETVLEQFESGCVHPLPGVPELTRSGIESTTALVAQMGHEPVIEALKAGCDVVLCGRCYDPAAFAAGPIQAGFKPGLAYHMGKILECAAIAAEPGSGRDCVLGAIAGDHFTLEALSPERRFTPASTAAHSLYEKSDPYHLPGPGGVLDLTRTRFEGDEGGGVRVSGSRYRPSDDWMVKLEGAAPGGYRTVAIAGVRDPLLINSIDDVIASVREDVESHFPDHKEHYQLLFHVYGKNGVMGRREPVREVRAHELGLVIEAVATERELSGSVCSFARSTFLHYGYPGRISTAGNLAFLHSPSDIACGVVYEFSIYHLMEVEDPLELFPLEVREV